MSDIYWVDLPGRGRLGVAQRPRRRDDIAAIRRHGVDILISMLEPQEAERVGLSLEAQWCAAHGVEFISQPITDHGIPSSFEEIGAVVDLLRPRLDAGHRIAAHCFAGLGRSPLMIAALLIDRGLRPDEACELISSVRGYDVPEREEQMQWLEEFALLQRR